MAMYSGFSHRTLSFYSYVKLPEGTDPNLKNGFFPPLQKISHEFLVFFIQWLGFDVQLPKDRKVLPWQFQTWTIMFHHFHISLLVLRATLILYDDYMIVSQKRKPCFQDSNGLYRWGVLSIHWKFCFTFLSVLRVFSYTFIYNPAFGSMVRRPNTQHSTSDRTTRGPSFNWTKRSASSLIMDDSVLGNICGTYLLDAWETLGSSEMLLKLNREYECP